MKAGIDERRHFRAGDRVEFSHEKKLLTGEVQTFRFRLVDGGEEQYLNIWTADGVGIGNIAAAGCRLIGRAEPAPPAPSPGGKSVDVLAIAIKALSTRGATLVAIGELKALAEDYISLRNAIANATASDRTAPYREGEPRAGDGKTPPQFARWLTPRELGQMITEGKLPT
ncbi:MAG TPA: hypothetical protein VGF92_01545 [Stellaceae bacterium]|jgi:hypothetical protein